MLFLLLLAAACAASNGPRIPQCKTAGWEECVPVTDKPGIKSIVTSGKHACVMCKALKKGDVSDSPFPFLAGAKGVAIRGYSFDVLSAKSLAPLGPSVIHTLALIDANITDVENNTFAGFSSLELSLDSNRLTNVKQTWFNGLEKLLTLILSNNHIKRIDPGSFIQLTRLNLLDLENNLLQVVDPAWLFGLKSTRYMNLGLNEINTISPDSLQQLQLNWLDLRGNDLSCLDGEVFRGQSYLSMLHVSSGVLSSIHDANPHELIWSLRRLTSVFRGSATMVGQVPKFLFCVRHSGVTQELSFGWMFDSLHNVPRNVELGAVNPGRTCVLYDNRSLTTISIQTPVVVLATGGSMTDNLVPNVREQCIQVWEYNRGISVAVGLGGTPTFRLVSLGKGNTTFEGVAMSFDQTQDRNALNTERECSQKHTNSTNSSHDNTKNITCILLTKDEYTDLFFTVPKVQSQTHITTTTYRTDTDHSSSPTHYSEHTEKVHTFSKPETSTLQVSNTPGLEVPPASDHVLISVVVSAVVSLSVVSLALLLWKLCPARSNREEESTTDDAHIWIIPPGIALPGLFRSASLPACPRKLTSDDAASCRSLPAVLQSIEPTYCEIPDDIAAAHRPLPGIPHIYTEILDDAISGAVRSASLPAVTCRLQGTAHDSASCRSLPAVALSLEPTYNEIPDGTALAKRPLPALPQTCWEIPYHDAAAQRPLPTQQHTYSEIPDDESGPMPFYADAADLSLHVVTNRRPHRRAFRDNTASSSRDRSGGFFATYGSAEETKAQSNDFYRKATEVKGLRSRRQLRTALVSQSADQGLRTYVNVTNAILSRGQNVTEAHIAFLTMHDSHQPWEISGDGTCITPRRASLPYVTLPNTYWQWEIPGDGTCNIPRPMSLPCVTLLNTYWPWEIPAEETRNTPQPASLPYVTLPNTYWPWEIPGEGTRNTPRRASLPYVTLPNTYWPWEIPGEGTRNTPRRSSLPCVTLPNTYWPWEIPGEGTRNTPRRASLPYVTLPNTYWPWEIPGEGTRYTPRRASLPYVTLPNTYWPWEIPGEGTRYTPRRASLPYVTLPNTYWPWEIPGEETCNLSRRTSLP
ncbi:LRIG3 [Branchiostoma lanceolatum]|uniref:LRIG3 protein n=1 Tax=Branchiostoma lanceolatum TaxID=7740 RepID=A0A8J9ZYB0_BRALA|nr:LRIG3 [Branchiostoma lanceolatum]